MFQIDAILFTHEHSDHTAGLDDIRPFFFKQKKDIPIYAHQRVLESLKKRFDYIFETENKYPGSPGVETFEVINNKNFVIGQTEIIPINVDHGNLQVFGYRINDFAYLTDVKTIDAAETDKLKGVKALVINALREEPHHSHFSLQDALDFITLVQPEKAYLTHIRHYDSFGNQLSYSSIVSLDPLRYNVNFLN